jgi:hypothetical protein
MVAMKAQRSTQRCRQVNPSFTRTGCHSSEATLAGSERAPFESQAFHQTGPTLLQVNPFLS